MTVSALAVVFVLLAVPQARVLAAAGASIAPAARVAVSDLAPPRAALASAGAFTDGDRVVVRWQTAYEVGVVSFALERLAAESAQWVQVNEEPVPATSAITGAFYSAPDSGAQAHVPVTYRLRLTDEQGGEQVLGPFVVSAEGPLAVAAPAAAPAARRTQTSAPGPRLPALPVPLTALDGSTFVKITTTNAGLQSVTAAGLAGVLGQPLAAVQAALAQGRFRLSNRGQAVSTLPSSDGSALFFYAEAYKDNYYGRNVYWLTSQTNLAPGVADGQNPPANPNAASYQATLNLEQDLTSAGLTLFHDPEQDYWMWLTFSPNRLFATTLTVPFALDHLAAGAIPALLTLRVQGGSTATHTVNASVNGQPVFTNSWTNLTAAVPAGTLPAASLLEGTNQLTLVAPKNPDPALSKWYLNSFSLTYARQYYATGGALEFGANSNSVITVDGFTNPDITVLDLTDPHWPTRVTNLTVELATTTYRVSFVPAGSQTRYLACQSGAATPAASLALAEVVGLASPTNAADYVVITPDSLYTVATNLAAYRQGLGLPTLVARLDAIYNEFAFGFVTPHASQAFLATAYSNWVSPPRYAVLIGSGTYDYRDLGTTGVPGRGTHDNLNPPLLVDTTDYGLFNSDSAMGVVDGSLGPFTRSPPSIAVGRLKGTNVTDLLRLVDKIKAYEAAPAQTNPRSVLMADKVGTGSAGDFYTEMLSVSNALAPKFGTNVILAWDQIGSDAGMSNAIILNWNAGAELIDYAGHGALATLGGPVFFSNSSVSNLTNLQRLSVGIIVSCVVGAYSVPGTNCMSDVLLQSTRGGAVAMVAATGLSFDNEGRLFNVRVAELLRTNALAGVGDAFRQAMADHINFDRPIKQPYIYNFLGDPALRFNIVRDAPPAASLFGHLYYDYNGNGTFDAGDTNLAQVTVWLTNSLGAVQTAISDAAGWWSNSVPPGVTTLKVDTSDADFVSVVPAGYTQTEGLGSNTVTVAVGASVNAGGSGFYTPGQVFGHVYYDYNGNGVFDAGDTNLAQVRIWLTNSLGGVQTAITAGNGWWTNRVSPGATTVKVDTGDSDFTAVVPAGFTQTEGAGSNLVIAVAGASVPGANAGFYTPGRIYGHLYYDANASGTFDAGDLNLAKVSVWLTNSQGVLQTAITDASGWWSNGVPPGATTVKVDTADSDFTSVVPAGFVQTDGVDPHTVTAVAGVSASGGNGGFFTPSPLALSITPGDGFALIVWSGGVPPYQLEHTPALPPVAPWDPVGGPTAATNAVVPLTDAAGFFRVRAAH